MISSCKKLWVLWQKPKIAKNGRIRSIIWSMLIIPPPIKVSYFNGSVTSCQRSSGCSGNNNHHPKHSSLSLSFSLSLSLDLSLITILFISFWFISHSKPLSSIDLLLLCPDMHRKEFFGIRKDSWAFLYIVGDYVAILLRSKRLWTSTLRCSIIFKYDFILWEILGNPSRSIRMAENSI